MPRFLWFSLIVLALATPAGADDVLGPQVCRACHAEAYAAWRVSPHARSGADLGEQARDPQCTSCHAPQAASGVSAVSCESCHGAGEHYTASYVMRDPELARLIGLRTPGDKECRACHDESSPSLKKWDHAAMLSRIDHWTAERAARRQQAPQPGPAPK